MTEELSSQIQTAAFCAYIMWKEGLSQPEAMKRMAQACADTQIALGLGHLPVRSSQMGRSEGA